jgi:hypothetical protein
MKIKIITKAQIEEEKIQRRHDAEILAMRLKFMGRLLQGCRDARDYLAHAGPMKAEDEAEYGVMPFRELMVQLNSLLDREGR